MTRALPIATALVLGACSTLGTGSSQPSGLPHGGVGPFRILDAEEIGFAGTPAGSVIRETRSIESGMVAGAHLFYAGARPLAAPPDAGIADGGTPDAGPADGAPPNAPELPDWSGHEPREILRSAPREGEPHAFDPGEPVLSARDAWEGGRVHDPWAIVLEDGRARLYYAAEGGVGVAEAPSVGGVFERVASDPTIARPGARRPTVVRSEGLPSARHAFLLYLELDGAIVGYGSDDGIAWSELGTLALPPLPARDERDSEEVAVGSPGAITFETQVGRAVLRLYYESRRADGQVLLTMAGSFDGESFEGVGIPVVDDRAFTMPAPRRIDSRVTVLYMLAPNRARGALVAGIAPAGVRLAEPEPSASP